MCVTASECHASEIVAACRYSMFGPWQSTVYKSILAIPALQLSPVESHALFLELWVFRLPFLLARSPISPCATQDGLVKRGCHCWIQSNNQPRKAANVTQALSVYSPLVEYQVPV